MTDTPDSDGADWDDEEPTPGLFDGHREEALAAIAALPPAEIRSITERFEFLELVAKGQRPLHAALAVKWTPGRLRRERSNPEFEAMIRDAERLVDETVEMSLLRQAQAGNTRAIEMWLFNRMPGTWRDTKRVEVTTTHRIDPDVVGAIRTGVLDVLERMGAAALQPGGALDELIIDDDDDG